MAEETHRSSAAEISVTSNGDLDQSPETVFQRVRAHLEFSYNLIHWKDVFRTTTLLRDRLVYRYTKALSTFTWVFRKWQLFLCGLAFCPHANKFSGDSKQSFWETLSRMKFFCKLHITVTVFTGNRGFWLVPFVFPYLLCVTFVYANVSPKQQQIIGTYTKAVLVLTFVSGLFTRDRINVHVLPHYIEDERRQVTFSCFYYLYFPVHSEITQLHCQPTYGFLLLCRHFW